ncbi:MAG: hypothetical protein KDJ30_11475 [Rhodoblastus sp.]|nr:hypothetical protein [Rhodoblastus sp.]
MSRRKAEALAPRGGDILATPRERERADMLRYISEMTGELASIAGAQRLPMLTYFLNMARVEAEMQLADTAPGSPGAR